VVHDQPGLFPDWEQEEAEGRDPILWSAHEEVVSVLDAWYDKLAEFVGFKKVDGPYGPQFNFTVQGTKYPTLPSEVR
jgi:hypothetical protein